MPSVIAEVTETHRTETEVAARRLAIDTKIEAARRADASGQVNILIQQLSSLDQPTLNLTPLSEEDHRALRWWCPDSDNVSYYQFDEMPLEVIERIPQWKTMFDTLYVMTPGRLRQRVLRDPILLGIKYGRHYLLARWAESASDILSLPQIRLRARWRWFGWRMRNPVGLWIIPEILLAMLFAGLWGPAWGLAWVVLMVVGMAVPFWRPIPEPPI